MLYLLIDVINLVIGLIWFVFVFTFYCNIYY